MVLVLFFAFFLFGCTLERDNPYDPYGINYDPSLYPSSSSLFSSSSLPGGFVPCRHAAGCAEISAEACFAFGGQLVASCSASSSSHLLAEVSSSGGVSGGGSSSGGVAGSSSSLPPVMVLCRLSDGTCPLTLISQEACYIFDGTPVQSCAGSSSANAVIGSSSSASPSSSSVAPSSSSVVPSSSSAPPSSSSVAPSSSSSVPSSSSFSFVGCTISAVSNSSVTCGGQTYRTVQIGEQVWFAENLNYNNYDASGSKCYDNLESYCNTYGRLYDWSTAMGLPSSCNSTSCSELIQSKHQGICPSGWHIPSQAEWNTLSSYVQSNSDCKDCDAMLLKATQYWNLGGNGTDYYGFSALPGGFGFPIGSFSRVGDYGNWWCASEDTSSFASDRHMGYYGDSAYWDSNLKYGLYSVRCLQD